MDEEKKVCLDNSILDVMRKQDFKAHLLPLNEAEERQAFFNNITYEPEFRFIEPNFDIEKIDDELKLIKTAGSAVKRFYDEKIKERLLINKLIKNRGNLEELKKTNKKLYGRPSKELYRQALGIIRQNINSVASEQEKNLPSCELKRQFEEVLRENNISDWVIKFTKNQTINVSFENKAVRIPEKRFFSQEEIDKLKIHEIKSHVFRSANGYLQPYKIFAVGLANNESTKEGLALYNQSTHGLMPASSWVKISTSVVCVYLVYANYSFRQIFNQLIELGLSQEFAWQRLARVFRGGFIGKDFLYLEGFNKVKEFAEENGLQDLYVGKIAIEHLAECRTLVNQGILKKPIHIL